MEHTDKFRLRFLHIPKVAGSTLAYILLRQYRGLRYFYFMSEAQLDAPRYAKLSAAERREIVLFLGHSSITTGFPEADAATLITLLRNPIARVRSFCQHVSEGKAPYIRQDFPPESFDLDRFLESGNYELSNMQTKMLINTGSCASPVLINSMSAAAARDLALENLFNRVSRFGIQEFFDESLILFAQFLHWRMPFYVSVNLRDPSRLIEFKQRHIDQIAELNSIDNDVYDTARQRFLDLVAGEEYDLAGLKRFRSLNPVASLYLRMRSRMGWLGGHAG